VNFGYVSLGLSAGQHRWTVFSGSIYVHDSGATQRSDQCYSR
jgi:hypothetical protein